MGFRFRKCVKLAPGVKLNLGKKSFGLSVGNRGGGISFNSRSGTRVRSSIPGTGLSYSSKLGGKKEKGTSMKQSNNRAINTSPSVGGRKLCPTPRKIWYIGVAICFVIAGLFNSSESKSGAFLAVAIGAVMLFFTYKSPKPIKIDAQLFNRYLQIFDESVNLFMSTNKPETFWGRYADAENAAAQMASMTDAPIVHNESPQEAVSMLSRDKSAATNAFLERYAREVKMKAFELTRGRKAKVESFMLITSEYEDKMSDENISYRDELYEEMFSKIENI